MRAIRPLLTKKVCRYQNRQGHDVTVSRAEFGGTYAPAWFDCTGCTFESPEYRDANNPLTKAQQAAMAHAMECWANPA